MPKMRVQKIFTKDLFRFTPTIVEPKQDLLKGEVYIGRTLFQRKLFFIDFSKTINPHICVFGMSGSGKSTFVKTLIHRYRKVRRVNAIIIDFAGEYVDFADMNLEIGKKDFLNILDLGGLTPRQRIEQIMRGFEIAFGISMKDAPLQYSLLMYFLEQAYIKKGFDLDKYEDKETPTLLDVYELIEEEIKKEEKKSKESGRLISLISLKAKLRAYASSASGVFARKSTIRLDEITKIGVLNFDLSKLPDEHSRILVGYTLLEYLLDRMRREGISENIKLFIVLDEAHKLAGESSPIIPLVKEGRKYGFAIIISTQDIIDVDKRIIANAGNVFVFKMQAPEQIKYLKDAISMSDFYERRLMMLKLGECIVKQNLRNEVSNIFVIKVDAEILKKVRIKLPYEKLKKIKTIAKMI